MTMRKAILILLALAGATVLFGVWHDRAKFEGDDDFDIEVLDGPDPYVIRITRGPYHYTHSAAAWPLEVVQ